MAVSGINTRMLEIHTAGDLQEFLGRKNSRATRPRDADSRKKLRKIGRRVLVIWECEIRTRDLLAAKLKRFLDKSTLTLIR